jgi:hypothetical protein
MTNYINQTRTDSIITINVESADNLKEALRLGEPGNKDVYVTVSIGLGINDISVPAGKEVRITGNTIISFLAVRSA